MEVVPSNIKDKDQILRDIEKIEEELDISFMDAVIEYSNQTGLEIEVLGEIIKDIPKFREQIREDAENLNFFKKTARLA